jgi:hypothetical protein
MDNANDRSLFPALVSILHLNSPFLAFRYIPAKTARAQCEGSIQRLATTGNTRWLAVSLASILLFSMMPIHLIFESTTQGVKSSV